MEGAEKDRTREVDGDEGDDKKEKRTRVYNVCICTDVGACVSASARAGTTESTRGT